MDAGGSDSGRSGDCGRRGRLVGHGRVCGCRVQGKFSLETPNKFRLIEIYQVDTLLQTSHTALQYSLQAQRFLDGILSSLTIDLRSRERLGIPSTLPGNDSDSPDAVGLLSSVNAGSSTAKSRDSMYLLRALAAAEAQQQSEETVAAAAMVAPVTAMTPRRPAAGMTPRRAGILGAGTTPRRGGYGKVATPAVASAE